MKIHFLRDIFTAVVIIVALVPIPCLSNSPDGLLTDYSETSIMQTLLAQS